ncbi:MAG: monovalent cation/H+ antiporter subunit D family protein [Deltaproteobacteria bacterium]|nr:monovalent cation/H+ antiporter subunit D family protein [Deltaproteobacteria bacterium]
MDKITGNFPILVVIIPVMASFLIILLGRTRHRWEWVISTVATSLSFLISLSLLYTVSHSGRLSYWLGGWEPPWGIEYAVDDFSGFVLVVVSFVSLAIAVYAGRSVPKEVGEGRTVPFFALYCLLVGGLLGMVVTADAFNLYVFLEISSLSSYALVGVGKKKRAIVASYNYLVLGTIGATFYLIGVGYLYVMTGTLNMADLSQRLAALYDSPLLLVALSFFLIGLSIKMALFPLHAWLPDAHGLAPSVVSPILSACVIEVAAYAMIRVMFTIFTPRFILGALPIQEILLLSATLAMLFGSFLALAQVDLKRMLAYSSVGQMGYILLGVGLANQTGLTGSLMHIFSHAVIKASLFLAAGSIIYQTDRTQINALRGLGKKMPLTMATFTIGSLGMVGIPLTTGFVSKWQLALGALEAGRWPILAVILSSALLNALYFGRVIEMVWFRGEEGHGTKEREGREKEGPMEAPLSLAIPSFILVSASIIFGVAALIPVSLAEKAAGLLLGK